MLVYCHFLMIIGLDYGGTIADSDLVKSKWILDELGLNIPPWKTDRTNFILFINSIVNPDVC